MPNTAPRLSPSVHKSMGPVDCLVSYKQQYKDSYDGAEDKLCRHIAYSQLARWCWGILGKEIRVVLPSCAVMCIRNFYPPPGPEEEFIFERFRYSDE